MKNKLGFNVIFDTVDKVKTNFFLLHGDDFYVRDLAFKYIIDKYSIDIENKFDFNVYYGDEHFANQIIEQLEMSPVIDNINVVVIKNYDIFSQKDKVLFNEYCKNINKESMLIIMSSKMDKRGAIFKIAEKYGVIIETKHPYNQNELHSWLNLRIKELKLDIYSDASILFCNIVDLDYQIAEMELQKLIIASKNNKINYNMVKNYVANLKVHNIFELQNSIGKRNIEYSINIINDMIKNQVSLIFVISMLNRFFQILWRINVYRKKHLTEIEISRQYLNDIFFSFRKDYINFAGNFSLLEFPAIFEALLDTDIKCKSSAVSQDILANIMIVKILK